MRIKGSVEITVDVDPEGFLVIEQPSTDQTQSIKLSPEQASILCKIINESKAVSNVSWNGGIEEK